MSLDVLFGPSPFSCNKEKLDSISECGMSFVGKSEVVICSGEDFFLIELNAKCKILESLPVVVGLPSLCLSNSGATCGENERGVELLASILVNDAVRKWFPDELEFLRCAPLRKHLLHKGQAPINMGCVQTLITLDGDDCSKKVPVQEFAKK